MKKEVMATGKGIEQAQENARAALGAGPLDDVQFEIIELGSNGILGIIGAKPTKIRAYMEVDEPAPVKRRHERQPDEETIKKAIAEEKKKKAAAPKKEESTAAEDDEDVTMEPVDAKEGEDRSLDLINTLIANLGIKAEAKLYKCSNGSRRIIISGDEAGTLIGHHGDTIDAVQYLANLASNCAAADEYPKVKVDVEGYRARREETLCRLATRTANKAVKYHRNFTLEPMNPYERRIIHAHLQGFAGVSTHSVGSGAGRRVVVVYESAASME